MTEQINSFVIRAMRPLFAGLIGIALVHGLSRQGEEKPASFVRGEMVVTIPAAN